MVNYYLRVLAPFAQQEGKSILLNSLHRQMAHLLNTFPERLTHPSQMYQVFMPHTFSFLCNQLQPDSTHSGSTDRERTEHLSAIANLPEDLVSFIEENCAVANVQLEDVGRKEKVDTAIVTRAFCLLLQTPVSLTTFEVQYKNTSMLLLLLLLFYSQTPELLLILYERNDFHIHVALT